MENLIGLGVSTLYILAILGISAAFSRAGASSEVTRKFVHIALGGWWFIAAYFFTSPLWATIMPALFIFVNAYTYSKGKFLFLSRDEDDTPGTVYYAVSLTILTLFSFTIGASYVGALGFFCMTFGDGFAAVIGKRFGKKSLSFAPGKTRIGVATMFLVSLVSCVGVLLFTGQPNALPIAVLLALAATVLEALSVKGLDNLTVPLGVSGLYAVLFLPAAVFTPIILGVLLSGIIVLASIRLNLLTASGAWSALAVGTLAFASGGWPLWLLLMWFFGSSNIASKIMRKVRKTTGEKSHETRNIVQVLANSIPFLVCSIAYAVTGYSFFLIISAAALAASTADTWASEIGVFSKKPPINILTGKRIEKGLSGGVSPLGLAATAIGSVTSAFLAMLLFYAFGYDVPTGPTAFLFIIGIGILGSFVDSVLGSLLQAKYRVPNYQGLIEKLPQKLPHSENAGYALVSGYAWVTNDVVNLMSGVIVVAVGLVVVL